jgi:large-conductance mechanosensitive channel
MSAESHDLKSFLINNNILTTMAGVTIAFSTGIMIRSLVGDIILPSFYFLFHMLRDIPYGGQFSAFAPLSAMNCDNFVKELVTWIVVVIVTYFFIVYVMKQYLLKKTAIDAAAPAPKTPPAVAPVAVVPVAKTTGGKMDDHDSGSAVVMGGEDAGTENFYQSYGQAPYYSRGYYM